MDTNEEIINLKEIEPFLMKWRLEEKQGLPIIDEAEVIADAKRGKFEPERRKYELMKILEDNPVYEKNPSSREMCLVGYERNCISTKNSRRKKSVFFDVKQYKPLTEKELEIESKKKTYNEKLLAEGWNELIENKLYAKSGLNNHFKFIGFCDYDYEPTEFTKTITNTGTITAEWRCQNCNSTNKTTIDPKVIDFKRNKFGE